MRLYQLFENERTEHQQVYDQLKHECGEFFELSKGFKYVPHREMALHRGDKELNYLFRFETLLQRESVLTYGIDELRKMVDAVFKSKDYASRYEHMVTSSSLGQNSQFEVNEKSPYLFPIGNFNYSYINDDFNMFTDFLTEVENKTFMEHLFSLPEFQTIGIDKVFHSKDTLMKFYMHMRQENRFKLDYDNDIEELADDLFGMFDNIHNNNYKAAFNDEHEIWFNCNEYYLITPVNYKIMMEEIHG